MSVIDMPKLNPNQNLLSRVKDDLINELKNTKECYQQMFDHKKGQEFKEEFIKGFDAGAMFIIDELFGKKE